MRVRAWDRWLRRWSSLPGKNVFRPFEPSPNRSRTCPQCGGSLPIELSARLQCRFCGDDQPNPEPLPPGTEAMVGVSLGYALGRVDGCNGPESIRMGYDGGFHVRAFDQLIPVVRAPHLYRPGVQVFAKSGSAWDRAWLVRGGAGTEWVIREHWHDDRSPERHVHDADLRIAALEEHRATRGATEVWIARVRRIGPLAVTSILAGLAVLLMLWVLWNVASVWR